MKHGAHEGKPMPMKPMGKHSMSQQKADITQELPKRDNPMAKSGGTLVPLGKRK